MSDPSVKKPWSDDPVVFTRVPPSPSEVASPFSSLLVLSFFGIFFGLILKCLAVNLFDNPLGIITGLVFLIVGICATLMFLSWLGESDPNFVPPRRPGEFHLCSIPAMGIYAQRYRPMSYHHCRETQTDLVHDASESDYVDPIPPSTGSDVGPFYGPDPNPNPSDDTFFRRRPDLYFNPSDDIVFHHRPFDGPNPNPNPTDDIFFRRRPDLYSNPSDDIVFHHRRGESSLWGTPSWGDHLAMNRAPSRPTSSGSLYLPGRNPNSFNEIRRLTPSQDAMWYSVGEDVYREPKVQPYHHQTWKLDNYY